MHDDAIIISAEAAGELIAAQFPEWSGMPVRCIRSSGTVNAIFRIGDDLAARFPMRPGDPVEVRQTLQSEAEATARFGLHSPFPAPTPLAIGEQGDGYPMPWSVQTWLPGEVAAEEDASGSAEFAHDLARLVAALRPADTGGRSFERGWRGGDLHDHDAWVRTCLDRSEALLDVPRLTELWDRFVELPRASPDVMSHGDLTPSNVLVAESRLAGVLDCGGFGPADPALDLIAGWHLLGDETRAVFRAELGVGDLEWERAKAWAFEQSMGAVWYYAETNPLMSQMGRRTLARIVAETQVP